MTSILSSWVPRPRLCVGVFALLAITAAPLAAADNELTQQEQQDGWVLLFDGKSTSGWMSIKEEPLPEKNVQEGALNPHPCNYMLVHGKDWENFRLEMDFKIAKQCNSGIFLRTFPLKPREGRDIGYNGIEVAVDDTTTADFHEIGRAHV